MAFPVTLNGRTYTLADFEGNNYVDGLPDAFEDFVTQAGSLYSTTSTTSNTIGTGSKTFTVESSKPYQVGTPLRITDTAAPTTNWMDAIVTSYSGTTLVVTAVSYAGSGTKTAWSINIGGGGTSYTGTLPVAQGGTGATTAAAAATNLGLGTGDSPTFAGIDITGTLTSDGLTVDGDVTINDTSVALDLMESDTVDLNTRLQSQSSGFYVKTLLDDKSAQTPRFFVSHATGDIAFYEDTGTTPKFFWDASAEALGIGTSSPSAPLHVSGGTANGEYAYFDNDYQRSLRLSSFAVGANANAGHLINASSSVGALAFAVGSIEAYRVDSSGNVLVGKTTATGAGKLDVEGGIYNSINTASSGSQFHQRNGSGNGSCLMVNRTASDGILIDLQQAQTRVGAIGYTNRPTFYSDNGSTGCGIYLSASTILPTNRLGAAVDNAIDLGQSNYRYDDIFATNGTIQTSDRNEKQDIAELDEAEKRVAIVAKGLIRKYRWKDSVAEKGDAARIHVGIIAQDLQDAFAAEGLDAGNYAMFISSTWWEADEVIPAVAAVEAVDAVYEDVVIPAVLDEEGNEIEPERTEQRLVSEAVEAVEAQPERTVTKTYETAEEAPEGATERTRLGVRYPELLAFIIGAL